MLIQINDDLGAKPADDPDGRGPVPWKEFGEGPNATCVPRGDRGDSVSGDG